MTKKQFDKLTNFPVNMVSKVPYEAKLTKLKRGDSFVGIGKTKLGEIDYSIIDSNGHPHYFLDCDLLCKDSD
ncbi:MAG TPA: hypothetical protein PK431_14230 [Chitinophagales bacterium]|nr:hypothetical protein [Chitinophagales bacterium]